MVAIKTACVLSMFAWASVCSAFFMLNVDKLMVSTLGFGEGGRGVVVESVVTGTVVD